MSGLTRRQELLPQDVRDVLAAAFADGLLCDMFPANAVEIRLDDPMRHLMDGGEGFVQHSLSVSACYFKHRNDDAWALVEEGDCDGDPERGRLIMREAHDA